MKILPYDPNTFLVSSQSDNGDWYLVDLDDAERPLGRCTCDDYIIRIDCPLNKMETPPRLTCKHVRFVLRFLDRLARATAPEPLPARLVSVALRPPNLAH